APRPGEAAPGPGLRAVPQLGTTKVDVIDRPVSGLGAARLRGGRVCFSEEMTKIVSGVDWKRSGEYGDIVYETAEGIAKITINRPEVHNAFRPQTLFVLQEAFNAARDDSEVGVVIFTGAGDRAFCSGGDQKIRGEDGYLGDDAVARQGIERLNVLDLQVQIRRLPKP